jgi:hypothetical protein
MEESECFESYPWWTVAVSNLVSLAVYGLGAYIVFGVSWIFTVAYLAFVLVLEVRLLARHCVDCCYYGKSCAFGKGRLSAVFFKRGDPERFNRKSMSWRDMVPDLLVALVPVITGIVLLVLDFSWVVLAAVVALILLATVGNAAVRGSLACRYCRQRELGCPAEALFQKKAS